MSLIKVKFLSDSKIECLNNKLPDIKCGDLLVVDMGQMLEIGYVIDVDLDEKSLNKSELSENEILRKVGKEDKQKILKLKEKAKDYLTECEEKVERHKLDMKIVDIDLTIDEKKLTIYFTSDDRVDFRGLVADCIQSFKKVVRLQQIDTRQQVKKMGGIGKCGQVVCCKRFLNCPGCVDMKQAQNQNLSEGNVNKINGLCGKLMCCLSYENECYKKAKSRMPKIGDRIRSKSGVGEVVKVNVLKNSVTIRTNKKEYVEVKL